jgi:hypothetical protein
MSNPITRGGNGQFANVGSLANLANGAVLALGLIAPSSIPAADILISPFEIRTGSGASGTGTVALWVLGSESASIWPGLISPTSTLDQHTLWNAAIAADPSLAPNFTKTVLASTSYVFRWFNIASLFGNVPSYVTVVFQNSSGGALDATGGNFSAGYAIDSYS